CWRCALDPGPVRSAVSGSEAVRRGGVTWWFSSAVDKWALLRRPGDRACRRGLGAQRSLQTRWLARPGLPPRRPLVRSRTLRGREDPPSPLARVPADCPDRSVGRPTTPPAPRPDR